jgi:hypothetical protein
LKANCFRQNCKKKHPKLYHARRPVSLVFTLLLVIAVVFLALFIVILEVGRTFQTLRAGIPMFVNRIRSWWTVLELRLPELNHWISGTQPKWDQIIETVFGFLQNGAAGIFQSTMGIATSVFSGILNFLIGFVFAIYVLLRKDLLACQCKKLLYAYLPEKPADETIRISRLANRIFSNLFPASVWKRRFWAAFFCRYVCFPVPLCHDDFRADCVYRTDSGFWRVYRLCGRNIDDSCEQPDSGAVVSGAVSGSSAIGK